MDLQCLQSAPSTMYNMVQVHPLDVQNMGFKSNPNRIDGVLAT